MLKKKMVVSCKCRDVEEDDGYLIAMIGMLIDSWGGPIRSDSERNQIEQSTNENFRN